MTISTIVSCMTLLDCVRVRTVIETAIYDVSFLYMPNTSSIQLLNKGLKNYKWEVELAPKWLLTGGIQLATGLTYNATG